MTTPSPITRTLTPQSADQVAVQAKSHLIDVGRAFHHRGWSVGTSSNYSIALDTQPVRLLITASGKHKERLTEDDFVVVDERGQAIAPDMPNPSAETLLHTAIVQRTGAGAVLHTHSVWGTILSDYFANDGGDGEVTLCDYEMLKGLEGIRTHEHTIKVPVFDNTQDMAALAQRLQARFDDANAAPSHGFLLRHHGLYTWGNDIDAARRHVEVFEFLFEVAGRRLSMPRPRREPT